MKYRVISFLAAAIPCALAAATLAACVPPPQRSAAQLFNIPTQPVNAATPPTETQELALASHECEALVGARLAAPLAQCRGDKALAIHVRHHPKAADADLLAVFLARTVEIEDRLDRHKITKAQRDVEVAQANSEFQDRYAARMRQFQAEEAVYQDHVASAAALAEMERRARLNAASDALIGLGAQLMAQPTARPTGFVDCTVTPNGHTRTVDCW